MEVFETQPRLSLAFEILYSIPRTEVRRGSRSSYERNNEINVDRADLDERIAQWIMTLRAKLFIDHIDSNVPTFVRRVAASNGIILMESHSVTQNRKFRNLICGIQCFN